MKAGLAALKASELVTQQARAKEAAAAAAAATKEERRVAYLKVNRRFITMTMIFTMLCCMHEA